jgi:hypothetical protein
VPDSALADALTDAAERLLNATDGSFIAGGDVAREIGRDPKDPAVYHAFREVQRRGTLRLEAWEGGMGLPRMVGLPKV